MSVHTRGVVLVGSSEKYLRTAAEVMRELGPSPGAIALQTPAEQTAPKAEAPKAAAAESGGDHPGPAVGRTP